MNPSTHNPHVYSRLHPVNPTTVGGIQASVVGPITERSLELRSDRARDDTEALVAIKREPDAMVRKEDIREFVKAGVIIGATILALRLYAAIASPSPW